MHGDVVMIEAGSGGGSVVVSADAAAAGCRTLMMLRSVGLNVPAHTFSNFTHMHCMHVPTALFTC